MKHSIFLITSILLLACNNESESDNDNTSKGNNPDPDIQNDSIALTDTVSLINEIETIPNGVSDVLSYFDEELELPLLLDSLFLKDLPNAKPIKGDVVNKLLSGLLNHDLNTTVQYTIRSFNHIDSLKSVGAYEEYVENLDIGMTKMSDAFALFKTELDPHTILLLWSLESSSYEACPYFDDKMVFVTLIYENEIGETLLIAEESRSGDPPMSAYALYTSTIDHTNKLKIKGYSLFEEEDYETEELISDVSKNNYSFSISEGKFIER